MMMLYPNIQMTRFYAENLAFSQEPDGFLSSRAIESDDDDSLLNLFDAINYHKAAAIIHMIAEMAGQKNFQAALIEYLNKYAYDNAKGVDLWKIVEKVILLEVCPEVFFFYSAFKPSRQSFHTRLSESIYYPSRISADCC